MVNNILLVASWALSLAFVYSLGSGAGYRQAQKERMQFLEAAKGFVINIIERFKGNEKTAYFGDSFGGSLRGSMGDKAKGQEATTSDGSESSKDN